MNDKTILIKLYDYGEIYSIFSNKYNFTYNDFKSQLMTNDGLELESNTNDSNNTINDEISIISDYIQNDCFENYETYIIINDLDYWKAIKRIDVYDDIYLEFYGYGSTRDIALDRCDALIEAIVETYPNEI